MAGGKSTPKKDKKIKVSQGEAVVVGKILVRGVDGYKAGKNVKGLGTLYSVCRGKVSFTHKRIAQGTVKTFINVIPE